MISVTAVWIMFCIPVGTLIFWFWISVYGIPSTGNAQGIVYNKKVFEAAGITTCSVIDYIPEWRRKEAETAPQKQAPVQKESSNIPKPPYKEKQPDRSGQPPAYDLAEDDEIGMVECTVDSILDM